MASTVMERGPITATENERGQLIAVDRLMEKGSSLELVAAHGERVQLPLPALKLFHQLVHLLAEGKVVTLVPSGKRLTTQQAADILNVSRPHLVQLLERGDLPFSKSGTHRRIRFEDLMSYKRERDARQVVALDDLARMSQELGLYSVENSATR